MAVYDFLLTDWITMGLNRQSLEETVKAVESGKDIPESLKRESNRKYIEKILREEVYKQFSDKKRPFLELALNSIDAKPRDYESTGNRNYDIKIKVGMKNSFIIDNGKSMNLEEILRLLIIPFNTEKTGVEEIGRFGVGFFSSLGFCLESSANRINIVTNTGKESYKLDFYSKEGSIETLRMRLKKIRTKRKSGTQVRIKRRIHSNDIDHIKGYLKDHLEGIPSYQARIFFKDLLLYKQVNKEDHEWHTKPVELHALGKTLNQRVGFRIKKDPIIHLTSQGVLVKRYNTFSYGAQISFPSAVQVVEGRDEFKIDDNYRTSVRAVFEAVEEFLREEKHDNQKEGSQKALDLIPSLMSAFSFTTLKEVPNIENICKILAPEKKYVFTSDKIELFRRFLGTEFEKNSFCTSAQGLSYWRELYRGEDDVFSDLAPILGSFDTQSEFSQAISKYPNIHLLSSAYMASILGDCKLVSGPEDSEECVMVVNNDLYANVNHRHIRGEFNPLKSYSVIATLSDIIGRDRSKMGSRDSTERTTVDYFNKLFPKFNSK